MGNPERNVSWQLASPQQQGNPEDSGWRLHYTGRLSSVKTSQKNGGKTNRLNFTHNTRKVKIKLHWQTISPITWAKSQKPGNRFFSPPLLVKHTEEPVIAICYWWEDKWYNPFDQHLATPNTHTHINSLTQQPGARTSIYTIITVTLCKRI